MLRISITLILALISYFGITWLTEYRHPEVKQLTATPPVDPSTETRLHRNGLPDPVIGTFLLEKKSSTSWLESQDKLSEEVKAYFAEQQTSLNKFTFDGKMIWFTNQITRTPVEVLDIGNKIIKLKMVDPPSDHKGSTIFFLQWNDQGYVWYSNYSHLEEGSMLLFRACYKRIKPL